jgi:uncharacterized protein
MDITPLIKEGTNIITAYGSGGFIINKAKFEGSVFLLPTYIHSLPSLDIHHLDVSTLDLIVQMKDHLELLLIGCGITQYIVPTLLREKLKPYGISCDSMNTGAACRTYNVLLSEERKVGALLVAV